jgi:hypothetical protein
MRNDYWESMSTPLTGLILLVAAGCLAVLVLWKNCTCNHEEQLFAETLDAIKSGESSQLDLHYAHGTDAFLAKVGCLPALTEARLDKTDVTNAGIKELSKSLRLKTLVIWSGRIDDRAIDYLSSVPSLERLDLSDTLVSDEGIHRLNRLSRLRVVTIGYARTIGEKSPLTDRALKHLGQLTQLKRIELSGHWYTSAAIADLRRSLPATVICDDNDDGASPGPPADHQTGERSLPPSYGGRGK